MHIAAVETALPPNAYSQDELIGAITAYWQAAHHNTRRVEQLHRAVSVGGRHLALPLDAYPGLRFGDANRAFAQVGTDLATDALGRALAAAGLEPHGLDAIFFTTVTGVAAPSIDARLVNRLGLRNNIKRTPMFGLGCVAGAAGIARVADYLRAYPGHAAALVSVELCSLTLQREDLSIPNLIASGLFGDGAAAVIGLGPDHPLARGPRVEASQSRFYPGTESVMGWDVGDSGFRIVLSAEVPQVVERYLRDDVDGFLTARGLDRSSIGTWICHPGGPKVLTAFSSALELPDGALQRTWDSLASVGNLSSASVLFVLRDTLADGRPAPGERAMLLAMGPGFCSELVLLRGSE